MEVPLAADHFGHIGLNSCIRLGKALEKYNMAWLEDMVPWQHMDLMKQITEAVDIPILTGEDIFLKEEFMKLVDTHAVDIVHPDLASSGGLLETKKIGDYAEEGGVAMAMHFAGTPVSFMANVHCAAATNNFLALEHHSVDVDWWEDAVKVTGSGKPLFENGFAPVQDGPGLGIELVDEVLKEHLYEPGYFEPTPEWDKTNTNDRLWSMNPSPAPEKRMKAGDPLAGSPAGSGQRAARLQPGRGRVMFSPGPGRSVSFSRLGGNTEYSRDRHRAPERLRRARRRRLPLRLRMVGTVAAAEDVVQDCFLELAGGRRGSTGAGLAAGLPPGRRAEATVAPMA